MTGNDSTDDKRAPIVQSVIGRREMLGALAGTASVAAIGWRITPALADCIHGNGAARGPQGTWRIFQNTLPPVDNASTTSLAFPEWPCTDAYTWNQGLPGQALLNASNWAGRCWVYIWANRAINSNDLRPNSIQAPPPMVGTKECRVQYSTVELANAATRSQIRHWLGMKDWYTPWTSIPGNSIADFVKYSDLIARPDAYFPDVVRAYGVEYKVMTDRPWLLTTPDGNPFTRVTMMNARPGHVPGVVLDYEVADLRDTATTTALFAAIYADLRSKKTGLFVYTDPLDRCSPHGLDNTNLPAIAQNSCDFMTVMLWGQNPGGNVATTYLSQVAMLTGPNADQTVPWNKIALLFEMNHTTLADAQFAYNTLSGPSGQSPQAVCFWPNSATQGGGCGTNKNAAGVPVNRLTIAVTRGSAAAGSLTAPTVPAI